MGRSLHVLEIRGPIRICSREGRICLKWKSPEGKWRIQTLEVGTKLPGARILADQLADQAEKVAIAHRMGVARLRIDTALERGIGISRSLNERHRKNLALLADQFCRWLTVHHRRVVYWDELTRLMIYNYIEHRLSLGLSAQTVKHDLNPIRQADNYVQLITPGVVPLTAGLRHPRLRVSFKRAPYVSRDVLMELMRGSSQRVECLILLSGFCGLRISEACRIRTAECDWEASEICVPGSAAYKEKSGRRLPIPKWVAERLKQIGQEPGCVLGPGFDHMVAAKEARRWFQSKRVAISARNLRTSFANMAAEAMVPMDWLRGYMGHQSGGGSLTRHYADTRRVALLRREVVDRMDEYFNGSGSVVDVTKDCGPDAIQIRSGFSG